MTRFILNVLVFFLVVASSVFSQDNIDNKIVKLSARIVKKSIELRWEVEKKCTASAFIIYYKKVNEDSYISVDKIYLTEYEFISRKDSTEYLNFSVKHVPLTNGVIQYRITLLDISGYELSQREIKVGYSDKSDFVLHQNSPNPFNPVTNISFELNTAGHVKLKVFAIDGKEVAVLLDEMKNPGRYKIEFDISRYGNYSSGIYFYKLDTDYSSDIKKMIFTK